MNIVTAKVTCTKKYIRDAQYIGTDRYWIFNIGFILLSTLTKKMLSYLTIYSKYIKCHPSTIYDMINMTQSGYYFAYFFVQLEFCID